MLFSEESVDLHLHVFEPNVFSILCTLYDIN